MSSSLAKGFSWAWKGDRAVQYRGQEGIPSHESCAWDYSYLFPGARLTPLVLSLGWCEVP